MDVKGKECPSCKQQIQVDASFCPYCGARFAAAYQGYCPQCHAIRDLNSNGRCAVCGGDVYDRQARSQSAVESPMAVPNLITEVQPKTGAKAKQYSSGCLGCARIVLAFVLLGFGVLLAAYYLSDDFRLMVRRLGDNELVAPAATEAAQARNDQVPEISPTVPVTRTPRPTSTPDINLPLLSPNSACVGTYGYGITCLDDNGWSSIGQVELPYTGRLNDMIICGNRVLLIVSDHLYEYSGGKWKHHGQYGGVTNFLACGTGDGIWVLGPGSAHHYDGATWTDYLYETIFSESKSFNLRGAAAAPDGQVWVASSDHVLHYDGVQWSLFDRENDLRSKYTLTNIAVDSKGVPWVTNTRGLNTYDGKTWTNIAPPATSDVNTVYVDAKNRVWVGTDGGVSMYLNGSWQRYPINKLGGVVTSMAMDDQERMWVGTDWGLGILEKGQYTFYHMANSGLAMNSIRYLFVGGSGPALPGRQEKDPGSLSGRLVDGSAPLAGARVEVCVQNLSVMFSGATPCSNQPFMAATSSDAEGNFIIQNLPSAFYTVTFQMPDGKWKVRSQTLSIGSVQVLVYPGENTSIGEMNIKD